MNAQAVVNTLQKLYPDWSPGDLLSVVNDVVQLLLKKPLAANIYFDPTTGKLPYLVTTAGTYTYSISTVWRVWAIVTDEANDWAYQADSNAPPDDGPIEIAGQRYYPVPCRKTAQRGTTNAGITFTFNPGASTTTFRVLGYAAPASITGLGVEIPIDDQFKIRVVVPACEAIIDAMDNGRYSEAVKYIRNELSPVIDGDSNSVDMSGFTPPTW